MWPGPSKITLKSGPAQEKGALKENKEKFENWIKGQREQNLESRL